MSINSFLTSDESDSFWEVAAKVLISDGRRHGQATRTIPQLDVIEVSLGQAEPEVNDYFALGQRRKIWR